MNKFGLEITGRCAAGVPLQRRFTITARDIGLWLAEKRGEGLADSSVEKIRIVLGRSFALALRWGIPGGEVNPVQAVPRRRFNNARERYLTAEEAGRLRKSVEASSNPQLKHIVGLLLLTGARVGDTPARSSGSSRSGMRT